MISLNDVLLAMSNIPVDDPIAEIWGRQMQGGYKIIEYTGSLPITITANGDALIDYRIYGTDGGVGVATENLIDADKPGAQRVELEPNTDYCMCKYTGPGKGGNPQCNVYGENDNWLFGDYINVWVSYNFTNPSNGAYAIISFNSAAKGKLSFTKGRADNNNSLYPANYIPYGYKLPMVTIKNLFNPDGTYETNKYKDNNGTILSYNGAGYYTQYMPISSEDLISVKNARGDNNLTIRLYYYDSQKNWIGRSGGDGYVTDFTATPIAGAAFIQLQLGMPYAANADKIIISQGRTTTPVYIGENQLDAGEYVSYSDGKIYHMVDGTLTPTDPPVSLPEIPTIDGTTIIDYDGDPKPSQVYVKYKGKSDGA